MFSKASNCTSRRIPRGVYFIAATLALTGASFHEQACALCHQDDVSVLWAAS